MLTLNAQTQLSIRKLVAQTIGRIYQGGFTLEESYAIAFHTAILYLTLKKQDRTLVHIHQIFQRFSLDEIAEQVTVSNQEECGFNENFMEGVS